MMDGMRWQPQGLTVFESLDQGVPFGQMSNTNQAQAQAGSFSFSFVPYQIGQVLDLAGRALKMLAPQLGHMVQSQGRVVDSNQSLKVMPGSALRLEDGSLLRLARRGDQVLMLMETKTPEGREVGYAFDLGDPNQFREMLGILRRSVSPSHSQVQPSQRVGLFEFMQSLPPEQRLMMMVLMFFLLSDLINGLTGRNRSGGGGGGSSSRSSNWNFSPPQGGGWYMWG